MTSCYTASCPLGHYVSWQKSKELSGTITHAFRLHKALLWTADLIKAPLWRNWQVYNEAQKWPCDFAWIFILELGTWTLGLMTSVWRTSHSNRLPWGLNPGFLFVYLEGFKNTPAWAGSVRNQTLEAGALAQVFLQVSEVTQCEARTGKHREAWPLDLDALWNLKHETLRASRLHGVTCLL